MSALSLVSRWFIEPGCETEARSALTQLAADVHKLEPGALTYLVHVASAYQDADVQSRPPAEAGLVLFFETYESPAAFHAHLTGPAFTGFVARNGGLFMSMAGRPYTTVQFLDTVAGFAGKTPLQAEASGNAHPAVMFEVIARDAANARAFYQKVFGWTYDMDTGGFAYVHFPGASPPLMGGIGQAEDGVPGFEPGHGFYLQVDAVEPVLAAALAAGGSALMPATDIDGYRFAMFRDPEGNPIGIIEPFDVQTRGGAAS